ncbi:hypothetical protein H4R27_004328, partial [Coemansia aciculifera]
MAVAFSRPYEEPGNATGGPPSSTRPGAKPAPRVGRHGAHYHPLPSHWREHESGSSGVGSPVTPEGAGDDLAGISRTVGPSVGASSQTLQNSMQGGVEASRSFHSPRDYYYQGKAKTTGQSPIVSPRLHIGTLREAFGSASSLEWNNDRPGSSYSCQSTDQAGPGYVSEIQAESPLDIPAHGGRFPPSLSSMAARPGAGRSALASHTGNSSRHHPSASTSSSHYSFGVNSPPSRNAGSTAAQFSAPKEAMAAMPSSGQTAMSSRGASNEAHGLQGEDIVRKYLGLQRRAVSATNTNSATNVVGGSDRAAVDSVSKTQQLHLQKQRQQHRLSSTPSITAFLPQELPGQTVPTLPKLGTGSASPDDASSGSIVFRRAVSSGDLPTLEEPGYGSLSNASVADSRSFLTPDLVESPLEALVRRLTIELFQLYVNEDRKKNVEIAQSQQNQSEHQISTIKSNTSGQFVEEDEFVIVGGRRSSAVVSNSTASAAAAAAIAAAAATPGDGYIQQFRLGPSLRSGSSTPAVTMDGYFDPQATTSAEAGVDTVDVRPRPRHRLLQRTWMEEALIKARRVSTIDENADEAILQSLDQEAVGCSPLLAPSMPAATSDTSKTPSPLSGEDVAQFSSDSAVPLRIAQRGQALGAGGIGMRGSPQRQGSAEGMWPRPGRIDLAALSEEPLLELPAAGQPGFAASGGSHIMSPRGFYRARDPAAPHRKLPAERRVKGQHLDSISPARASLIRAVGRRQSVRLQPGKGQIVVAETHVSARGSAAQGSATSASVSLEPDAAARAKRANSLPGLMQVPETREVSYADQQRKAARAVAMEKAPKSRARIVHRAERMVLGGTQPASQRADDGHGVRKRHTHKRAGSRADMDQQLLCVELPPPVPLRVRREQVKMVPEPLIIVRRPATKSRAEDSKTPEERILRVHNQLLGAQAVLSRHNSVMRHVPLSVPGSGTATPRAGAGLARDLAARSVAPAGSSAVGRMSMQAV